MIPTTVTYSRPETWRGQVLRLALPPALAPTWVAPGQYCMLSVSSEGEASPFVIANAPGCSELEFYVQRSGALSETLCALQAGARVFMSAPLGPGFPAEDMVRAGGPVILVTNGSGVAGVRGMLRRLAQARVPTTLFQGCRQPGDFPYLADLMALQHQGVDVQLLLSGDDPHWRGLRGHIQDHLEGGDAALPPHWAEGWLVLCGVFEMQQAVARWAAARGLPPARICTNH